MRSLDTVIRCSIHKTRVLKGLVMSPTYQSSERDVITMWSVDVFSEQILLYDGGAW